MAIILLGLGMVYGGIGIFVGWLIWGDRAGRFVLGEAPGTRSGWVHDGVLYVAEPIASDDRSTAMLRRAEITRGKSVVATIITTPEEWDALGLRR